MQVWQVFLEILQAYASAREKNEFQIILDQENIGQCDLNTLLKYMIGKTS